MTSTAGPILITGGAGFIGCNLADRLASEGFEVIVFDALVRPGVQRNLAWLQARHGDHIRPVIADVRDRGAVIRAVDAAGAVFHFAAQVAVTTSLSDPRVDFDVNVGGTINVLEAVRQRSAPIPVLFASTNKVYGDLADVAMNQDGDIYRPADASIAARGICEDRPLDFHTPYGCSKGAADQYVLDYARSFDVPAAVLRMSCIYGQRQMGTEDQGWVAHFLIRALSDEPITLYGDGRQVRDILHVDDAVAAYLAAWRGMAMAKGRAFNLGGGAANAVSLRQLLAYVRNIIGRPVRTSFADWRTGDQRYYVSDNDRLRRTLGWSEPLDWRSGVARLADWLMREGGGPARQPLATEAVP